MKFLLDTNIISDRKRDRADPNDDVPKQASQELTGCLREGDVLARLGGDEFSILTGRLDRAEDAAELGTRAVSDRAYKAIVA